MGRNIEGLTTELCLGDFDGDNFTGVDVDGKLRWVGNARVWQSFVADLVGRPLNSTSGKVNYDWNENAIKFLSGGNITLPEDRVQANFLWKDMFRNDGLSFTPFFYWWQPDDTTAFQLTLRYRIQRSSTDKETSWTDVTYTVGSGEQFTYSGTSLFNQISVFSDISVQGMSPTDIFQVQIARTDTETADMYVLFFGIRELVSRPGASNKWPTS